MTKRKIVLAGGSGFLGKILVEHFSGEEVVVLSRNSRAESSARVVYWDGRTLASWTDELEGADVVINLSGRSVDCRYTPKNRQLIMDSRVDSTRVLGEAIARCSQAPEVWINLSTATIYKHRYGEAHGELNGEIGASAEAHDLFSIEVAQAWEKAFSEAHTPETRKITLRSAMVLGHRAGVYPVLRRLTRLGLGGTMADGKQWVSWIHEFDCCAAVDWLIAHKTAHGVYNLSAPNPIRNAAMMGVFRKAFGVPFGLPSSLWMLTVGAFFMRTEIELVIKSRKVVPTRLLEEGFSFQFEHFADAITQLSQPEN